MVSPKFSGLQYAPIFGEYLLRTAVEGIKAFQDPIAPFEEKRLTKSLFDQEFQRKFKEQTKPVFQTGIGNTQLPFGDKTLGEAAQDTLVGTSPLDIYLGAGFASKGISGTFNALKGTGLLGKPGGLLFGGLKAITEPISKNPSFQRRLAAELAFDTGIRFATEAGGTAFGLVSPLVANLTTRGIANTGKKMLSNPPSLKDYINNPAAANVARPSRVIPVDERPTLGGASTDPNPLEFYGRDTSASTTGNSPDPSFRGDGEFQRLNFKIKLMDANDIITSNDPYSPTFAKDPRYPEIKQPRERLTTREEQLELVDLAKNLRADDLIDDTLRLDSGMPIIGSKHVESGNKRMMAIKLAKKDYPEVYDAYVTRLRERLEEFGIPRTDLDQFDLSENIPVIVRERQTVIPNDKIRSYVIDANTSNVEAFSAAEEAGQLAEGWSSDLLNRLIPVGKTIQDSLRAATNSEVVSAFLSHVKGNPNAKNWFKSGKLTEEGITKLVQGLRVRIFGQDNADFLIRNIDELPDQQTKSLFNAIDEALPQLAVIKGKIGKFTQGTDYDISGNIIGAIRRFRQIKELAIQNKQSARESVSNYLNQTQMFNEFASDPVELQLLRLFDGHGKGSASSKQISSVISKYEELVEQNIGQATMFGPRTKLDILEQAIRDAAPEGTEVVTGNSGRILTTLEDDVKYQEKPVDDPDFDKDIDDALNTKEKKDIEKDIREQGNYKPEDEIPINKIESDINPKNTPVTKNNLNDPIINTGKEDDIPLTNKGRQRHNNRPLNENIVEEVIVVEKDILDSQDVSKVVPSAIFKQLIGDLTIELENTAKQQIVNRVYAVLRSIPGINPEKLNIKQKEKSIIEGMITFYDNAVNNVNSKVAKIAAEVDARANKVFDIEKETGLVNGVGLITKQVKVGNQVIEKSYRPTVADLAADPLKYNLTQEQIKALESIQDTMLPLSQLWKEIPDIYEKYKFVDAMTARKDINPENGYWIPRGGAIEEGKLDELRTTLKKGFNKAKQWNKSAEIETQGEGIDNGYVYQTLKQSVTQSAREIMMQSIVNVMETAAKNLRDASGNIAFKTMDDLIAIDRPGLIEKKKEITKNFTRLTNLKNVLEVRTQEFVDALLNGRPEDIDKIIDILENKRYVIKSGPSASMTRKEIIAELDKVEKDAKAIKKELKNAQKNLDPGVYGFSRLESLGYKELDNLYLSEDAADSFNNFFQSLENNQRKGFIGKAGGFIRSLTQTFNSVYLMTKATFDNSGPGIQGLTGLFNDPKSWAKAVKANMQALALDKDAYGKAVIEFDEEASKTGMLTANDWINYGLIQNDDVISLQIGGQPFEKGRVQTAFDKLPFNQAFTTFGNIYRLKRANELTRQYMARGKTIEEMAQDGTLRQLAETANRLSGTMNISRRYRTVQDFGVALLFAPRYYATRLRNFYKAMKGTANPFTKDVEAKIMARELQQFMFYAMVITYMINSAQGKPTDFNPITRDPRTGKIRKNGNFMTIKTPRGDVSLLGSVINVPMHLFNLSMGLLHAGQVGSAGQAASQVRDTLKSVGSGAYKLPIDLLTNKEWNGTPIRNDQDTFTQQAADVLLYLGDAFAPFSFTNIGESIVDSVKSTTEYLRSEKKAQDLGYLVQNYGANAGYAFQEFGGILSSEYTYTDILAEEARKEGFDYTRLEPHQQKDFKEKVQQIYAKEKEGLFRSSVGRLLGRSTEPANTPIQQLQEDRVERQKLYLTYYKRGYKDNRLDRYTIKDFAKDVRDEDEFYYNAEYGVRLSEGEPYNQPSSFEEKDKNRIALDQYYDLNDIYYDSDKREVDQLKYDIQKALLAGREVTLKDGSVIGDFDKEQIDYIIRNTNDQYYDPEVLQVMLQAGRMGVFPLKYWYEGRVKSEKERERFKRVGSPGTALDPNAKFFWDSRTFNLRLAPVDVGDINPTRFLDRASGINNQLPPGLRQGEGGPVPAFQFPEGSPYRRD
jgi:hypothetical protein